MVRRKSERVSNTMDSSRKSIRIGSSKRDVRSRGKKQQVDTQISRFIRIDSNSNTIEYWVGHLHVVVTFDVPTISPDLLSRIWRGLLEDEDIKERTSRTRKFIVDPPPYTNNTQSSSITYTHANGGSVYIHGCP